MIDYRLKNLRVLYYNTAVNTTNFYSYLLKILKKFPKCPIICEAHNKYISTERRVPHERQKAHRLQRHVRGAEHTDDGRSAADGVVL